MLLTKLFSYSVKIFKENVIIKNKENEKKKSTRSSQIIIWTRSILNNILFLNNMLFLNNICYKIIVYLFTFYSSQ